MQLDHNFELPLCDKENLNWFNPLIARVKIYGLNWIKKDQKYQRLPKECDDSFGKHLSKCLALSKQPSGGQIHFITDSTRLMLHAKISGIAGISGMTFVAQGGFDCYVGPDYDHLQFYDSARFVIGQKEYEYQLFQNTKKEKKLVVINLPLYASLNDLALAIDKDATIEEPSLDLSNNGRIVYYGTSIAQGGCASRPGLSYLNILSRMLKMEILNFGFSGNAFGEKEIAEILADINDTTMFVIDYEANGGTNGKLEKTLEKFIKIIRFKNKTIPIVVISRIKYLFDELNPQTLGKRREEIRRFQEQIVKKLQKEGDSHLYYINGSLLLGDDYHEYTVDGVHPNDLGFMQMAKSLKKGFLEIIEKEKDHEKIIK